MSVYSSLLILFNCQNDIDLSYEEVLIVLFFENELLEEKLKVELHLVIYMNLNLIEELIMGAYF